MKTNKIVSYILCFLIVFSIVFLHNTPKAKAIYPVSASIANMIPESWTSVVTTSNGVREWTKDALATFNRIGVTAAKIAALLAVQQITQAIIGSGDGGVISDWNNYLYVSPQQRAMAQMNAFFNTASRGRLSTLNYEGVGPNYDAYLVAQARLAIAGQPFTTNLQDSVTDPSQIFAGGNMKGIVNYMKCANNVACYTLTSSEQYKIEFAKAQEIARNQQMNGFLPIKKNGKIVQPAAFAYTALTQVDQMGTQIIMNADADVSAYAQIAAGAGISIASRSFNYMLADSKGKDEIRNKNDQFPFSLGYSTNGGVGISAGGVTATSGVGQWSGGMQIGNTCATGNFTLDSGGATVDIHGNKITCPASSRPNGSVTPATIKVTGPSASALDQTVNTGSTEATIQ
jgi:hypothetical protein